MYTYTIIFIWCISGFSFTLAFVFICIFCYVHKKEQKKFSKIYPKYLVNQKNIPVNQTKNSNNNQKNIINKYVHSVNYLHTPVEEIII